MRTRSPQCAVVAVDDVTGLKFWPGVALVRFFTRYKDQETAKCSSVTATMMIISVFAVMISSCSLTLFLNLYCSGILTKTLTMKKQKRIFKRLVKLMQLFPTRKNARFMINMEPRV
jgi:hypothetical protein